MILLIMYSCTVMCHVSIKSGINVGKPACTNQMQYIQIFKYIQIYSNIYFYCGLMISYHHMILRDECMPNIISNRPNYIYNPPWFGPGILSSVSDSLWPAQSFFEYQFSSHFSFSSQEMPQGNRPPSVTQTIGSPPHGPAAVPWPSADPAVKMSQNVHQLS